METEAILSFEDRERIRNIQKIIRSFSRYNIPSFTEVVRISLEKLEEDFVEKQRERVSPRDRKRIWRSQGFKCFYCRSLVPKGSMTIDHRIPKAMGGDSSKENVVLACHKCNMDKGSMSEEEFLKAKATR